MCTASCCCPVSVKWNSLLPPPNQPVASVSYVLLFSWPDTSSMLSRAVYVYRKEARILTCNQHTTIIIQTYYPTICLKLIYFPSSFWIIINGFQFLLLMKRCKTFHHLHHCYLQFFPHNHCPHRTHLLETPITSNPIHRIWTMAFVKPLFTVSGLMWPSVLILWQSNTVSDFFTSCVDIRTWTPSNSNPKYKDITLFLAPSWLQICIGICLHTFCIFPCTLLALTNTCSAISQFTLQDSRMHPDVPQTIKEFAELQCTTHNSACAVNNHKNNILSKKLRNKSVCHLHYIPDSLSFQLHISETLTYPPDLTLFLAHNEINISSFTCISKCLFLFSQFTVFK